MNDQNLLQSLFLELGAVRSAKCNYGSEPDPRQNELSKQSMLGDNSSESSLPVSYCLLNEFQYQNGMMQFFCSLGRRDSSVSLYVLGMEKFSAVESTRRPVVDLPMMVHPNYCNDKLQSLETAGLLPYNRFTNRCRAWNITHTSFANRNWTAALKIARQELKYLMESAKQRCAQLQARRRGPISERAPLSCSPRSACSASPTPVSQQRSLGRVYGS